jgi:hypothetical protein
MRIAREMKTLLASLFGPSPPAVQRASKDPPGKSTTSEAVNKIGGNEPLSPGAAGNGFDRVTLSARTAGAETALKSSIGARADLPSPLLPAVENNGTDAACRTPGTVDADRPVVALLPAASVNHQSPHPAADPSLPQESPETRRLVRSVYGSPQTASRPRENEPGSRLRVRA